MTKLLVSPLTLCGVQNTGFVIRVPCFGPQNACDVLQCSDPPFLAAKGHIRAVVLVHKNRGQKNRR